MVTWRSVLSSFRFGTFYMFRTTKFSIILALMLVFYHYLIRSLSYCLSDSGWDKYDIQIVQN